jgi:hypothetical protein
LLGRKHGAYLTIVALFDRRETALSGVVPRQVDVADSFFGLAAPREQAAPDSVMSG